MKTSIYRTALVAASLFISSQAFSQYYYVVIGAFAEEPNAKRFVGYARSKFFDAKYLKNPEKNLFYVYVMKTKDKEEASDYAILMQHETEFTDTWAYHEATPHDIPEEIVPMDKRLPQQAEIIATSTEEVSPIVKPKDSIATVFAEQVVPDEQPVLKPKGKFFKFVLSTENGGTFPGEVHHVDFNRGRDLGVYKTNEYIDILRPEEWPRPMAVVCGIFGYKEVIKYIDYNDPSTIEGAHQDEHGAWVIPYQLERLKKGDASIMYHVSFYKDAVVMLPQSKTEMDELVNMMKLNPGYVIRIHGHCNGNNSRKIIALGDNKNYFNITGSDEKTGTAKELSTLRAESVRSYLVDNGISEDRMKIYAWGGLDMLVNETSSSARLNDRIEIEILED